MHRKRILMWLALGAWHLTALAQSSASSPTPTPTSNSVSRTAASDAALAKSSAREVEKYWFERDIQKSLANRPLDEVARARLESRLYSEDPEILRMRMKSFDLKELERVGGPWVKEFQMIQDFVEQEDFSDPAINRSFGTKLTKPKRVKHPLGGSFTVSISPSVASPFFIASAKFGLSLPAGRRAFFESSQTVTPPIGHLGFDGATRVIRGLDQANESAVLVLQSNGAPGNSIEVARVPWVRLAESEDLWLVELFTFGESFRWIKDQSRNRDLFEEMIRRRSGWSLTFDRIGQMYVDRANHLNPDTKQFQQNYVRGRPWDPVAPFGDSAMLRAFAHQHFYETVFTGRSGEWTVRRVPVRETLLDWIASPQFFDLDSHTEWQVSFVPKTGPTSLTIPAGKFVSRPLATSVAALLSSKALSISREFFGVAREFRLSPITPFAELSGRMDFALTHVGQIEVSRRLQTGWMSVVVPSLSHAESLMHAVNLRSRTAAFKQSGNRSEDPRPSPYPKKQGLAEVSLRFSIDDPSTCLRFDALERALSAQGLTIKKPPDADRLSFRTTMQVEKLSKSFSHQPPAVFYALFAGTNARGGFAVFNVGQCILSIEFSPILRLL
jgi:hypothetical protein